MKKNRTFGTLFLVGIFFVAIIILPTGTPEDLFTTIPFIAFFGMTTYIIVSVVVIAIIILLMLRKRNRKFVRRKYDT